MKLLDRYILKEFAKNLLLVLSTFLTLYLLVEFFESIDNFIEEQKPISLAIRYFLLKIPFIIEQLMPVSILLAGIITLGFLNHSLELSALKAAGITTPRIVRPLILGGLLCIGLTLAMGQWLLPTTVSASNKIWYEEVDTALKGLIIRNGRVYYRGTQGFYSFDARASLTKDEYFNFSYATWDASYQLDTLLTAKLATWQQGVWVFSNGQLQRKTKKGDYSVTIFDEFSFELPEDSSHLFIPEHKFAERSISELFTRALEADDIRKNAAWLEFHKKISYNTLGLPLLILGLPMLLLMHQRWGRDLSIAVPGSCVLAFLAWMWWGAFQTMANNSLLNPIIASWSIHFCVGLLGIMLLRQKEL